MKKNHYIILLMCLVVIAVIIVCIKGFNVDLEYAENTSITIDIGQEFDVKDIRAITDEIFGKDKVIVAPVEVYKDVVQIKVKEVNDEQLESLKTKINEKYELEKEVSDFRVVQNANTRLRDIVSHYILPIIISFVIIHAYELIRFRKLGILNIIYIAIIPVVTAQILLACIYAISRIPVSSEATWISLFLYVLSEYKVIRSLAKKLETELDKEKKESDDPIRAE